MKPPRALLGISCAVLVAAVVTLFAGAATTGVTTDEPYHVQRFNNWVESGWYIADFQEVDGEPTAQTSDQYVYGPATTGLLHLWNRLLGTDRAGEATVSAEAYLTRHLGIALISLLAVVAVIALGRILLRSWGWGIVAAACLTAIPLWTGHAMFNVKDPPVAAGYTLFTLGLVLVLRERAGDRRTRLAVVGLLAAGTFVTIGTRPGMWAGLLVSLTVMLVGLGWSRAGGWPRKLGESLAGVAIGLAGCLALYPNVFGEPITAMTESFSGSATYNDDVHDRTWLTDRLGVYLPTFLGLLALLGLVAVVRRVWADRGSRSPQWIRWSLVGAQLLVFPVGAVVFATPLDGDLRQLLLSLPALAVMAAAGAQCLVTRASEAGWPRLMAPGLVAVALVVPVVDSATLFPYNYLYFTPAADAVGADNYAQADNWTAGGRELVSSIPDGEWLVCRPTVVDNIASPRTDLVSGDLVDCRTSVLSPVSVYLDRAQPGSSLDVAGTFLALSSLRSLPSNCVRIDGVERSFHFRRIETLSLWRCRNETPLATVG